MASKPVQEADTATMQQQEDMRNVEKAQWTTTKPQTTFEEMLNALSDSLGNLASSDHEEYGDDEHDE